jgi:hypothetical protein
MLGKLTILVSWSALPGGVWLAVFVRTSVFHLLAVSRPTDISRFVVAIVIDTVKHVSWRTFSNISQEVFKFVPTGANFDPALSIVFVARGKRK